MAKKQSAAQEVQPQATPEEQLPAAKTDQLPAAQPVSDDILKDMYGDMDREHVTIPRLVMLEQLNPEVGDKLGESGDFFVKSLNRNLGKGPLEIVVLMRSHSRMRWRDINAGGGIICQAIDGKRGIGDPGGDCSACGLKEWGTRKDPQTGATVTAKPQCDLYENFIVVLRSELQQDESFPMAISGSRTKLKGLRDFNTMLMQSIQKRRPLFAKSYVVKAVEKVNPKIAGNNKFHVFQISPGNENALLPDVEQKRAMDLFMSFRGKTVTVEQDAPGTEQTEVASDGPSF